MELRTEDFPVALQAFEVSGNTETFIAEQVVSTQVEADGFMARYAGKLIKTRDVRPIESSRLPAGKRRLSFPVWGIILILLIILLAVAYATGWLQKLIDRFQ